MAEANDALDLPAALNAAAGGGNARLTIKDLPKDVLVTVLVALKDQTWVRHNIPCVCKAWNEMYCSRDASPLHETLEVDFEKDVDRVTQAGLRLRRGASSPSTRGSSKAVRRVVAFDPSRVAPWAKRRAGWVHHLLIKGGVDGGLGDFTLWKKLLDAVAPKGVLRSLVVEDIASVVDESDVEPLGQLARSLEELVLETVSSDDPQVVGLLRFPGFFCDLTELKRLALVGHENITAIPAEISSLKKLEDLDLSDCDLSSLPKELGELSQLARLDLSENENLGETLPADSALPAELGGMKALRELDLSVCGLSTVPAFVGELKSLEVLDLSFNKDLQIDAPLDFLIEGCPRLRRVRLCKRNSVRFQWTPASRAHLREFKAKLRSRNPAAKVSFQDNL